MHVKLDELHLRQLDATACRPRRAVAGSFVFDREPRGMRGFPWIRETLAQQRGPRQVARNPDGVSRAG